MTGDGKTARYRDAITVESDNRRIMTSQVQGEDGQWTEFNSIRRDRNFALQPCITVRILDRTPAA